MSSVAAEPVATPRVVLDPFQVYLQGEAVLQQQLQALDVGHLKQIARVYNFAPSEELDAMSRVELEAAIIAGTRVRVERT